MIKQLLGITTAVTLLFAQAYAGERNYGAYYCDDPCAPCEPEACCNRCWVGADYLYWQIEDSPNPTPLLIEAPGSITTPIFLDAPGTSVVLGGKSIKNDWRSGIKAYAGYWFDNSQCLGGELSYFVLPQKMRKQTVGSDALPGSPFLAIPFFDVLANANAAAGVAVPGRYAGTATLKLSNSMQGAEANVVAYMPEMNGQVCCTTLFGFRYWNYSEKLNFNTDSPYLPNVHPNNVYLTKDKFEVDNNFYGGQIGLLFAYEYCGFFASAKGQIALGAMCSKVDINGSLSANDYTGFGAVDTYEGGYFALPTNIGHYKKNNFSVLPEINVNFGYTFCDGLTIQVGYSFLYASEVLWAGQQIDDDINPTQSVSYAGPGASLVGEASPKRSKKTKGLWAQGVNAGLVYAF